MTWDETTADFWTMVKMVFNAPGVIPGMLASATAALGHPPTSWVEMRGAANTSSIPSSWLDNAEAVGQFGAGGGSVLNLTSSQSTVLLLGGLAIAAILVFKKPKRR